MSLFPSRLYQLLSHLSRLVRVQVYEIRNKIELVKVCEGASLRVHGMRVRFALTSSPMQERGMMRRTTTFQELMYLCSTARHAHSLVIYSQTHSHPLLLLRARALACTPVSVWAGTFTATQRREPAKSIGWWGGGLCCAEYGLVGWRPVLC